MTKEEIAEYWRTAYYNEKHKKEELEKENEALKAQIEKLQKEKEEIIHQEVVDMYSRFPC